ncbi:TonB-dependent receptor [Tenacibaculum sp. M341]|uniref:TonB-dependent receptor n=1 Tax=Tenacibaculum sp. M341 TaxID=2530339 RepID=UPI00104DC44D|nr:TonB-dependent receptor [Tenacibaculum sp. M341]TCI91384.1 TonB-dependent receptor [Tenacibaculum sp. M341]
MNKHIIFSMLILMFITDSLAQETLKGKITDTDKLEIFGANVYWLHNDIGVTTKENGTFEIPYKASYKKLIISFVGYKTDTINVSSNTFVNHVLTEQGKLDEIRIDSKKKATAKSFLQTQNVFTVNSEELLKAACCNLAESFETNPSIDVNFSDALTGTRQIQMLGLNSPYLLIAQENIPMVRGASQVYGLTFTPGTWVESIQITKGAGSVVNGFESISGQINAELVKPTTDKKFFVNGYGNLNGRLELNTHFNQKVSEKWNTGLYVHGNIRSEKFDNNNDNFLDNPLAEQINVMNRWQFTDNDNGWVSFFNVRFLNDRKQTGNLNFNPDTDKGSTTIWGSEIKTNRFDFSGKLGYVFPELPYQSMGLQLAYSSHDQESYFGLRTYEINHQSVYSNVLFNSIIGDTRSKFKTGLSFTYDKYEELVEARDFSRTETSVGAFFEYAYDNTENFSATLGLRIDHHNLLKTFVTPRIHLRYVPWEKGVLRASVGRGKRSANIFAENQQLFASARQININDVGGSIYGLDPEIAWNYGVSFLQGFRLFDKKGDISFDFYQTNFENQVVVDWENPQEISFYNLNGKSIANSFQTEVNYHPIHKVDVRLAYKFFDVATDYNSGNLAKPLQPKHRFFTNVSVQTNKKENGAQWKFDTTYNLIGTQRLPNTSSSPVQFQLPAYTDSFNLLNFQVTKVFSEKVEVYVGGDNITNVKQKNPILESENPFGANFDSTIVYAPIFGSTFYTGFRFKID